MKLLTKTTLYFLLLMLPVFTAGAFYLFSKFNKEIKHETDEELVNDKLRWMRYLDTAGINTPVLAFNTQEFELKPTDKPLQTHHHLKGVNIYQETEDTRAPFRQLSQVISFHGSNYELVLRKSLIEQDDLVKNIAYVMLLAFGGLLLFAAVSNFLISKNVWKPFYRSLDKIRQVELHHMKDLSFPVTPTEEFNHLNTALNNMAARIHRDYTGIRELAEDAAHEMQTPLAIAQSKLELLLQDEHLSDAQLKYIAQSSDELQRLSRLNHNLLLLAKIENQQFPVTAPTDLRQVIEKYLHLFEELITEKQLTVETVMATTAPWPLHAALAEILVSNLLGNAIKYNYPDGVIRLELSADQLVVSNSSRQPEISATTLFQRFKKHNTTYTGSNGLGLAIVKKIADAYHLSVAYHYRQEVHTFTVTSREA